MHGSFANRKKRSVIRSKNPLTNRLGPNLVFPNFRELCSTTCSPMALYPACLANSGMYRCIYHGLESNFSTSFLYAFRPQLKSCKGTEKGVQSIVEPRGIVFVKKGSCRTFFQPEIGLDSHFSVYL